MKQFDFWKPTERIQRVRKRLKNHMENDQLVFLLSIDRQLQRRNRALRWGNSSKAIEHEKSLHILIENYYLWKHDGMVQSILSELLPAESDTFRTTNYFQYMTDSLFLYDCYHFLMQGPINSHKGPTVSEPEWACAVTGPLIGEVRILDRLVEVKISHQSAGGIQLSTDGLQQALVNLQCSGHALHAVFHSHRMKGIESSCPSRIDLSTQEHILEVAYPAIQAIFTEDGYIRFFSVQRKFNIDVYGKGVEHVEGTLFKLQDIHVPATSFFHRSISTS
jgi:hypothetical protein